MPDSSYIIRGDNEAMKQQELQLIEFTLRQMAQVINNRVAAGAVYPQIILPPDEAARKRALMEQGNV